MIDYYAVLGLPKSASKTEIRYAYRRLAKQWHPDKNPSPEAQQKFIAITEAYEALMSGKTYSFKSFSSTFTRSKPQPQKTAQDFRNVALAKQQEQKRLLMKRRLDEIMKLRKDLQNAPNRKMLWYVHHGYSVLELLLAAICLSAPFILSVATGNFGWLGGLIIPGLAGSFYFSFSGRARWTRTRMLFRKSSDFLPDEIEEFFFREDRGGGWDAGSDGDFMGW